jgi:hypothetical protein
VFVIYASKDRRSIAFTLKKSGAVAFMTAGAGANRPQQGKRKDLRRHKLSKEI